MKKYLAVLLTLALTASLGAFCSGEEAAPNAAFQVASPSGAPGLALATLAVENPQNYTFLTAETITAEFANETADFMIAPLNAGAKLFKSGKSTYQLAAVVAWGNLFLASQRENFQLEDIKGAEVTLFGENTINSSITLYVLKENGIEPSSVSYLAGASNTQQLLLTDKEAIVLTAEPALTAARAKAEGITSFSINELYEKATGNEGFAQAGLFVRSKTAQEQPEAVEAYLAQVQESCEKCVSDVEAVAKAAVELEILPSEKVALQAIPNCTIRYMNAFDAREQIETTAAIDIAQYGGEVPADAFYYGAE